MSRAALRLPNPGQRPAPATGDDSLTVLAETVDALARLRTGPGGQRPQVSGVCSRAAAPTVGRMPEFLAETDIPRLTPAACADGAPRAAAHASAGAPAWFLGAVAVPEEETCFWLYEAPSAAAARAAMTRAGLRPERITQAVTTTPPQTRAGPASRAVSATGPPTLGARLHRGVPAAGAQPSRHRNPLPGPAAENGVMTGLARPCCLAPSLPPGS